MELREATLVLLRVKCQWGLCGRVLYQFLYCCMLHGM